MKPMLHSLLICLSLTTAPAAWADHEGHRHGQEAPKLDNLTAAAMPSCCPTDGDTAGRAEGQSQVASAAANRPGAGAGEPCRKPEGGPAAGSSAAGKPCIAEGCKHRPDCACMKKGENACDRDEDCRHKACKHMDGRQGGTEAMHADDLRARIHQLERRLDMMQSVLESLLERPAPGRHMGGQH